MYIPLGSYDSNPIAVLNAKRTVSLPKVAVITHFGKAFEDFVSQNICNKVDTLIGRRNKNGIIFKRSKRYERTKRRLKKT